MSGVKVSGNFGPTTDDDNDSIISSITEGSCDDNEKMIGFSTVSYFLETPFLPEFVSEYVCDTCHYTTNIKSNYLKHLMTRKHAISEHKEAKKYKCDLCQFCTNSQKDYDRHLETYKHTTRQLKNDIGSDEDVSINDNQKKNYDCDVCGKTYRDRSGLWKHKQSCSLSCVPVKYAKETQNSSTDQLFTKEMITDFINNNSELREIIMEQQKMIQDLLGKGLPIINPMINNVQNNIQNNVSINKSKSFNLNFFLNETCKDAMNIMDFVDSIKLQISDLERVGELGYADGISHIFVNRLNEIASSLRPVHCSDLKRETLYIKDNNIWLNEEVGKQLLIKAIKKLANENIKMIKEWRKLYPDCTEADSKKNDSYLRIVSNSMCGATKEETENNMNKIVKNIAKNVVIDKKQFQIR